MENNHIGFRIKGFTMRIEQSLRTGNYENRIRLGIRIAKVDYNIKKLPDRMYLSFLAVNMIYHKLGSSVEAAPLSITLSSLCPPIRSWFSHIRMQCLEEFSTNSEENQEYYTPQLAIGLQRRANTRPGGHEWVH